MDDALVCGGVKIPDHLIDKNLNLEPFQVLKSSAQHIALLLTFHPHKLKEKFFELYGMDGQVNVQVLQLLDEKICAGILAEMNEVLEIKPFKLTTIPSEV